MGKGYVRARGKKRCFKCGSYDCSLMMYKYTEKSEKIFGLYTQSNHLF